MTQMAKTRKKNTRKQTNKAEGKKVKDPKRIAAARKAWQTIRAQAEGKQAANKVSQNPLN